MHHMELKASLLDSLENVLVEKTYQKPVIENQNLSANLTQVVEELQRDAPLLVREMLISQLTVNPDTEFIPRIKILRLNCELGEEKVVKIVDLSKYSLKDTNA